LKTNKLHCATWRILRYFRYIFDFFVPKKAFLDALRYIFHRYAERLRTNIVILRRIWINLKYFEYSCGGGVQWRTITGHISQ